MTEAWFLPIISALIASALSLLELATHKKGVIYWRISGWITCRLVTHGATAAISYAILMAVFGTLPWFRGTIAVGVAALCGPALFRSQLAVLGSGQEDPKDAPATAYRRILSSIDAKIIDAAIVAESSWVTEKAIPCIKNLPLEEIEGSVRNYLERTERLKNTQRKTEHEFLTTIIDDMKSSDDEKRVSIVYRLLKLEFRPLVVRLMRDGRSYSKRP